MRSRRDAVMKRHMNVVVVHVAGIVLITTVVVVAVVIVSSRRYTLNLLRRPKDKE